MDKFKIGTHIRIKDSKLKGEIVAGPNRKGEYELVIGALRSWISADKIEVRAVAKKQRKKNKNSSIDRIQTNNKALAVDFHGRTKAEAKELLDSILDRAILEDAWRIEITHGLGSGILKDFVHRYLKNSRHIKNYKLDDANPGLTIAYL